VDRNVDEIRAHHQRLATQLAEAYPTIAKYPETFRPLVEMQAFMEWRMRRCFDHTDVMPGARTPDGMSGYTLSFYGIKDDHSPVTRVTLTGPELDELIEEAVQARGDK
jgi:hypothetical protein